ncbi:transporter [Arthrobacter sp. SW1]|uniref:MFS transporter n=1 Tax=Arthrobacter sp. SW1 TaxID=1920889 RepID=UPI000877CEA5|nr:MFS transporter [Arthrobacter sp. SW1]OFI37125.1 transporter [Arthrobacter sp. SW1]
MSSVVSGAGRGAGFAVAAIVLAQWLGTSLWFSPSGAAEDLSAWLDLTPGGFGWLLAATQLGFIAGTLASALSGAADRFPPERIFAVSSLAGAALNSFWTWAEPAFALAWVARFGVGVALAGIYPMGMKMIVQRVGGGSGWALGWLVAMLTLGTAMPHILRAAGASLPWQSVILGASVLAVAGAVLILLIQAGHVRVAVGSAVQGSTVQGSTVRGSTVPGPAAIRTLIGLPAFRASCGGYLGHMWELYAFWSVVPRLCADIASRPDDVGGVAALSAVVIAAGSLGCVLGGTLSRRFGSEAVAAAALASSGAICLLYPLLPAEADALKMAALALWGFFVVADSPQFSSMTAGYVPPGMVGTALTTQNSAGFLLTVVSIVVLQQAMTVWGVNAVWLLVPGPVLGLLAMRRLLVRQAA